MLRWLSHRQPPAPERRLLTRRRGTHRMPGRPETTMTLGTILLLVLILLLIGAVPTWPHSRSWGYVPSGALGLVVVVLVVLLLLGRL